MRRVTVKVVLFTGTEREKEKDRGAELREGNAKNAQHAAVYTAYQCIRNLDPRGIVVVVVVVVVARASLSWILRPRVFRGVVCFRASFRGELGDKLFSVSLVFLPRSREKLPP